MKRFGRTVASLVLSIAVSFSAAAQRNVGTSTVSPSVLEAAKEIHLRVGSSNVLTFSSPVTRLSVGREDLVRVHILQTREILLQGLAAGTTTIIAWLRDGRRLEYDLYVLPSIEMLLNVLHDVDPAVQAETTPEGTSIILRGEVASEAVADEARRVAESLMGPAVRVVNLIRYPGATGGFDAKLLASLAEIDGRIRARRIESTNRGADKVDSIVLEGRVRDTASLVKAMTLAELQLGGTPGKITPVIDEARETGRNRSFGTRGSSFGGDAGNQNQPGISTHIARGQALRSASGRVLSFLQVDDIPQIMCSIRVLQVDRGKARRIGFDYRIDAEHVSIGSYHAPGRGSLPMGSVVSGSDNRGRGVSNIGGSNLVATFVDQTVAIAAAIDLLEQKALARSVAEPNITTLSGEEASVLVGGEVPIPITTVGETAAVQGFGFQDYGVRLDLRPTLAGDGLVALELSPSIIRPTADLSVSGVPGFQIQSVNTTARVAPGESLVIGGLLSFDEGLERRGIPGLSEVPVLRSLFSWEGRTRSEQELLFIITPRIITNVAPEPIVLPQMDWENDDTLHWEAPGEPGRVDPNGLPPSFIAPPIGEPVADISSQSPERDPR
jgi:Flp pilus assembly secretin CpaC